MDEKNFKTKKVCNSKDIILFYDHYAKNWDNRFHQTISSIKFHEERLHSLLALAEFKKNMNICELGVGTGSYLPKISPLVRRIYCVDGSSKMLSVLKKKNQNLDNIVVLDRLDLLSQKLVLPERVDLFYCFGLIEHIPDMKLLLKNCKKNLNLNGRIIFVTPNGRSPWYGRLRKFFRNGKHCSTDRYYMKEEIDTFMRKEKFFYEDHLYWGYFPAGVNFFLYYLLLMVGKIIDITQFKKYAGGLTIMYRLGANNQP